MVKDDTLRALLEFRRERDWEQFHDVRNLIAALSIEVHELMEVFLWAKEAEVSERIERSGEAIRHEIADIAILLTYLCHELRVDVDDAVKAKMIVNREKYPVDKAKGVATKYDKLS
jgi:NTP pyrophosphatase (non-canonical NTP hydrolase)